MLLPLLVSIIIVLGILIFYIFYLAPRLNPLNRAEGFIAENMIDEAIMEYRKILDDDPMDFVIHFKLAELYFKMNQMDQGVLHLEEVLKIGKYNVDVEKSAVLRKLAHSYLKRDEIDKAFQMYVDLLILYPTDAEALYHTAFISLGQEYFDMAQRNFDKLVKLGQRSFEIMFGAGIASYQNQKTGEAVEYFKQALIDNPYSDIANLSMGFSLLRKKDFKTALNYIQMVIDNSDDDNAAFIANRLKAILSIQNKKPEEAVKILEELLEQVRKSDMEDELAVILYDLGFALLAAEQTTQAYDYWNELYQYDRNFKKVQRLTTLLRREMDGGKKTQDSDYEESVIDHIDNWLNEAFPANFIWNICGLKSPREIDLSSITVHARTPAAKDGAGAKKKSGSLLDVGDLLENFIEADVETFRLVSSRVLEKMKYKIVDILPTYRENDGVDFLARVRPDNAKVLIWVRRWKGVKIGEIPLRNLAQSVNDMKVNKGLFVTTSDLTDSAETALSRLSKIDVIYPEELGKLLKGFF